MPIIPREIDAGTRPILGDMMSEAQAYPRLAALSGLYFTYYAAPMRLLLIGCDRVLTKEEVAEVDALLAAHAGEPD